MAIDGLGKQYKNGVWGLREFSLDVQPGLLAVVGPTGAGKTTLMRLLATVMPPTSGSITWNGEEAGRRPRLLCQALGYLPQHFEVYARLSGRQFLAYVAALKGLKWRATSSRVEQVLERVGLSRVADQKMGGYSNGMRRRVGLAQALLNDPQLLIVDEPGATLEAEERAEFCDLVGTLGDQRTLEEQRAVIVATDDIRDVASTLTTLALMQGGRSVWIDGLGAERAVQVTPAQLVRSVSEQVWSVSVGPNALVEIRRQHLISEQERLSGQVALRIISGDKPHPEAVPVETRLADAYVYAMHKGRSQ
jgi:ABC-type multidrug transport system ATPase subunit